MRGRLVLLTAAALAVAAGVVVLASAGGDPRPGHRAGVESRTAFIARQRLAANKSRTGDGRERPANPARPHSANPAPVQPANPQHPKKPPTAISPPPAASRCTSPPPPSHEQRITHRQWLSGVVITEYYPAPERWFVGRRVTAPGLAGVHHVDWLYSARGLAMEGDGVNSRGQPTHIAQLGSTGWVNAAGRPTVPVCLGKWSDGFPMWLRGGWRNAHGAVTFPLAAGGWSNGPGVRVLDYGGVTFAPGAPQPLRYYHSIAVDPNLIPTGSRVYVPAYRQISGGWFVAQDTGGAIRGHHIDIYRPAPPTADDLGRYMTKQRILVIPPA